MLSVFPQKISSARQALTLLFAALSFPFLANGNSPHRYTPLAAPQPAPPTPTATTTALVATPYTTP